jgi:hypothetical protein
MVRSSISRILWTVLCAASVLPAGAVVRAEDSKPTTKPADLPKLNAAVLAFAESKIGEKVGNGQCWTLAAEALKSAGAKHANGYTFGKKLDKDAEILPGDIFQFTSAKFSGIKGNYKWTVTLGEPHHTAVVGKVIGKTKYEILEQNPGPVKRATIDFDDLKSGSWEAWRPVAK